MPAATAILNSLCHIFSFSWLTGPIFEKELRVSSRRRRNYVLRFIYLAFMTAVLVLVWVRVMGSRGSGLYLMSRMSDAGKAVIGYTVWFQFCVTQVVAIIMLSASISDEIYNRTLGLLITTPISSFQIVMGKLFSKLLQLILLLAISLPLLAIVRVFGGVPWDYVVSSLCITLTTIIFVGSLSLFFSIFTRKAYVAIIVTFLTLGVIFALLPLGIYAVWDVAFTSATISKMTLLAVLFVPNPYCNMFFNTLTMASPRGAAAMPTFIWPLHCGIMLAASAVILLMSVVSVRRVALRQAAGEVGASRRKRRLGKNAIPISPDRKDLAAPTRSVVGPAVLWKEMRLPLLGRRKRLSFLLAGLVLTIILGSYGLCAAQDVLDSSEIHIVYAIIYLGLGILFTIVLPATCITSEKEARSWPLLLTTTLDNKEILFGKFIGTLRRCFPIWILLLGHTIAFSLLGSIHPVAILHIGILVLWLMIFLSCSGLYFSSRFKRTTTAVIMNFTFALAIWFVMPVALFLASAITRNTTFAESYMDAHPFVQVAICIDAAAGKSMPDSYEWLGSRRQVFGATVWMLSCMAGYVSFGALLAWRAQSRFRRNIF